MLLDNLFAMAGGPTIALMLFVILAFVGLPAGVAIACPRSVERRRIFQRLQRRRISR